MTTTYTAVFEESEGWITAWVEELPGAISQERTIEQARESLKEAIGLIADAASSPARQGRPAAEPQGEPFLLLRVHGEKSARKWEAARRIGVTRITLHNWRQRDNVFHEGTVRVRGLLRVAYEYRADEVERLRKEYRHEGKMIASSVSAS